MKNPNAPLDVSLVDKSIGYLLRRAARKLQEVTVPVLRGHDLSRQELTTLTLVHGNPDCTLRTLAQAVAVDPPAMNRIVNNLERKGLIARQKQESDARYTYFSISDLGQTVMQAASPPVLEVESQVLAALSPEERDALFRALRKLTIEDGSAS
jgi:DNA-binding MarR family transcriptional regulator